MCRVGVSLILAAGVIVAGGTAAQAAKLPVIQASQTNKVPACVTPGRLMAFLKSRNPNLPARLEKIAVHYMHHGEALKIRWDQAFYQMLVETNYLKFGRDVSIDQNNFAGLGATGNGEPGERFDTVSNGVKAHLQHVLMYAGVKIENPVAERTRKVQEWGILNKWRKRIGRPLTYTDLTRKWSPGDRGYSRDIKVTGERFLKKMCNAPDPHPEWVAEARGTGVIDKTYANATGSTVTGSISKGSRNYASEAVARGKRDNVTSTAALGGQTIRAADAVQYKVLNGGSQYQTTTGSLTGKQAAKLKASTQTALNLPKTRPSANGATAKNKKMKCNVFTASYGGEKAMIIKAISNGVINYTVLDVNEGKELSETQAYIAAYAKGGKTVGAYPSQAQALDQAFKLCPEN